IGDKEALRAKFTQSNKGSGWESQEQSGVNGAPEEVLNALAALNEEYLKKFGYIFLICATGKSAPEMLEALQDRIVNDPAEE
ncbi:TTL, partial [Symbiodinium microadriaticum]